jgi:hypothetical protein
MPMTKGASNVYAWLSAGDYIHATDQKGEMIMAIDYARMQAIYPKQKAALTRAHNIKGNPEERWFITMTACKAAVAEWDAVGAWPDGWARWQRELDDAFYAFQRWAAENSTRIRKEDVPMHAVRLEAL